MIARRLTGYHAPDCPCKTCQRTRDTRDTNAPITGSHVIPPRHIVAIVR